MAVSLIQSLIISLLLTLLLESIFAFVVGVRGKMDYLLLVLVNLLTNPLVVLLYSLSLLFIPFTGIWVQLILEAMAVMTEGIYYKKYAISIKRPFLFSLCINGFSYGVGLLINYFL